MCVCVVVCAWVPGYGADFNRLVCLQTGWQTFDAPPFSMLCAGDFASAGNPYMVFLNNSDVYISAKDAIEGVPVSGSRLRRVDSERYMGRV